MNTFVNKEAEEWFNDLLAFAKEVNSKIEEKEELSLLEAEDLLSEGELETVLDNLIEKSSY
jgi:hypothetical protein